jgi:glycine cleavage system regulatory protein
MQIEMAVPETIDTSSLREQLERISDELHIHIDLAPSAGNR